MPDPRSINPRKFPFKSVGFLNKGSDDDHVIHRLYRYTGECDGKSLQECGNWLKRELEQRGVKASYLRDDPLVFVVGGVPPGEGGFDWEEIPVKNIRSVLGVGGVMYRFGDGVSNMPYDILRRPPYSCNREVELRIFYTNPALKSLARYLFTFGKAHQFIPKYGLLRSISDLENTDGVAVLVANDSYLQNHYDEVAEVKRESFGRGRSHLQIINTDRIREVGVNEYVKANILSAVLFKAGCTPFRVEFPPTCKLCNELSQSLSVGIALKKVKEGYLKAGAVLMTGLGDVVAYVNGRIKLTGRSMEFSKDEARVFGELVGREITRYEGEFGVAPRLTIIARSRAFDDKEVEEIFDRINGGIRSVLGKRRLLFISSFTTDYNFGEGKVAYVPTGRGGFLKGFWFVQLPKFKRVVRVSFQTNVKNPQIAALAYIYLRSLDFTSLSLNRTSIAPVTYARRYLKWQI